MIWLLIGVRQERIMLLSDRRVNAIASYSHSHEIAAKKNKGIKTIGVILQYEGERESLLIVRTQ